MIKVKSVENSFREILGLMGICLIGFATGTYFESLKTGMCLSMFLFGAGLIIDALKK